MNNLPNQDPTQPEYEDLVKSHQKALREFLYLICPNQSAREDILQETNRVLLQKRSNFQLGTNFGAWARKIARLQYMSYLKQRKTKSLLCFDSDLVQVLAKTVEKEGEDLAQQRMEVLPKCLLALDVADRELVKLKYEQQLSLKTISEITGRSEGGLKQAYMRLRKSLGECIDRKLAAYQPATDEKRQLGVNR